MTKTAAEVHSIDLPNVNESQNDCHQYWWRDNGLRELNLRLLPVFITPIMIGYDGALIGGLLAIPQWYRDLGFSPKDTSLTGIMVAGFSLGGAVMFWAVSMAADIVGRRRVMMIGDVIIIATCEPPLLEWTGQQLIVLPALGQTFCYNARLYIMTRFLMGIGAIIILSLGPVLLTELAHPRQRGALVATYASFFYVGATASAWFTFGSLHFENEWSWRLPVLIQTLPPLLQLPLMLFVPESPRWLMARGKTDQAKTTLARYHANGHESDELVQKEYEQISCSLELEKHQKKASWMAFLQTTGNRRRLFIVVATSLIQQWSGFGIVTFYFAAALKSVGITQPLQQAGINGGLQTFNFFVALISANMVDRVGRRMLFIFSTTTMLLAMVGLTVATEQFSVNTRPGAGSAVVVMFFIFQLGFDSGYAPLGPLYPAEICPYYLRAKALALHYFITGIGGAAGQFANPVAMADLGWKYYLVYVSVLLVGLFVAWFSFPETKGHTVEEIATIFDKN